MLILDIARSAVVSHLTPTPDEICPVCKGMVKMHKYSPVSLFMTVGLNLHEHDLSSCVLSASTGYYPPRILAINPLILNPQEPLYLPRSSISEDSGVTLCRQMLANDLSFNSIF